MLRFALSVAVISYSALAAGTPPIVAASDQVESIRRQNADDKQQRQIEELRRREQIENLKRNQQVQREQQELDALKGSLNAGPSDRQAAEQAQRDLDQRKNALQLDRVQKDLQLRQLRQEPNPVLREEQLRSLQRQQQIDQLNDQIRKTERQQGR